MPRPCGPGVWALGLFLAQIIGVTYHAISGLISYAQGQQSPWQKKAWPMNVWKAVTHYVTNSILS
jgi:hypothetical protein